MTRAVLRFFTVLLLAIAIGVGMYLAMHYIFQPLANTVDPDTGTHFISRNAEPIHVPGLKSMARGVLSAGKNGVVVVFVTVVVEAGFFILSKINKRRKQAG